MLKRQKRRYLLVQVSSAFEVGQEEFLATVWRSVEKLYGEYGTSKTGLWLIAFDTDRKLAILRAMNSGVDIVRTALA